MMAMQIFPVPPAGESDPSRRVASSQSAATDTTVSFAEVMQRVALSATDALKSGEAHAIRGIGGEASVQEVVEAVMSAEQALRAAIAVRDRVVAAYQEISRMQI